MRFGANAPLGSILEFKTAFHIGGLFHKFTGLDLGTMATLVHHIVNHSGVVLHSGQW